MVYRSNTIFDPSFRIESVASQYAMDEYGTVKYENEAIITAPNGNVINENLIEIPVLVNEHFWFSKPTVINLTTQQLFFQLFTENNGKV